MKNLKNISQLKLSLIEMLSVCVIIILVPLSFYMGTSRPFANSRIGRVLQASTGEVNEVSFYYDSAGQRIAKINPQGENIYYISSGIEVVVAQDGTAAWRKNYFFNGRLVAVRTGEIGDTTPTLTSTPTPVYDITSTPTPTTNPTSTPTPRPTSTLTPTPTTAAATPTPTAPVSQNQSIVQGYIRDADTGLPLPTAYIRVIYGGVEIDRIYPNGSGYYSKTIDNPGTYWYVFQARNTGYLSVSQIQPLTAGQTYTIDFNMTPR